MIAWSSVLDRAGLRFESRVGRGTDGFHVEAVLEADLTFLQRHHDEADFAVSHIPRRYTRL